jgi:hypothetical protein
MPLLWSAVAERSGDTAFDLAEALGNPVVNRIQPFYCLFLWAKVWVIP